MSCELGEGGRRRKPPARERRARAALSGRRATIRCLPRKARPGRDQTGKVGTDRFPAPQRNEITAGRTDGVGRYGFRGTGIGVSALAGGVRVAQGRKSTGPGSAPGVGGSTPPARAEAEDGKSGHESLRSRLASSPPMANIQASHRSAAARQATWQLTNGWSLGAQSL